MELLPGDVARVNVTLARPWSFKAGQYMYLYMPSLGLWTSHPFSVAWTANGETGLVEKRSSNDSINRLIGDSPQTTMSFLIKRRDGFTSKLLRKVCSSAERKFSAIALAEGPFGKHFTSVARSSANGSRWFGVAQLLWVGAFGCRRHWHHAPHVLHI